MKKIVVFVFALALVFSPCFIYAADKGLHLGGLDKDAKKAKIEAKKSAQQAEVEAKKAEAKTKEKAKEAKAKAEKKAKEAKAKAEKGLKK